MTILDILLHPEPVDQAWDLFRKAQNKDMRYHTFPRPDDQPAIWLNRKIMDQYRPRMKAQYCDSSKHDNYLDQVGIKYPAVH